jgi:hypothetical protein
LPSINKRKGICQCGKEGKYGVFKIFYCEECYAKRKKSNHPSSGGLIALSEEKLKEELNKNYPYGGIEFIQVPKGDKIFASLFLSHYPESKGIVGRSINYLIIYKGKIAGIIGLMNPPYAINIIDDFFGINKDNRNLMNQQIANNHIFRLINNEPNLASRCLRILRIVVTKDWKKKYGNDLKGILTFVEPPRKGSCYLADNWKYLGMTKGKGCIQRSGRWTERKWIQKAKKHIYAVKIP